ncbi:cytochrome P450 2J4-like [Diadema setosum]|uniref:cytochrome P450 2J4-like n=1 Tax=Diadema setosum TaxID=31175 RepID=UPI003B3B687B
MTMYLIASASLFHTLTTSAVVLFVAWVVKLCVKRTTKSLPPGPLGLPFLGVAWELFRSRKDVLTLFDSWAHKYGPIVHFRFGPTNIMLLNTSDAMKEAFKNPLLNNRQNSGLRRDVVGATNHGVLFSWGNTWRDERQFVHSVFRRLGVGKKTYEDIIAAENSQLAAAMKELRGRPFDPHALLNSAVSNIICSVVFGTQYTYSDREFCQILNSLTDLMELVGTGGTTSQIPLVSLVAKLPVGPFRQLARCMRDIDRFVGQMIRSHQKTFDRDDTRDFIDLYLHRMNELPESQASNALLNLKAAVNDLFLAGTETTTTTLKWSMIYMMENPDVQSKVQSELDLVVGRDRLPTLQDRKTSPYTNAVILECMRFSSVVPLGVAHKAAADTTLAGYHVPKGTVLYANIRHVLHDERCWDNPETFDPDRFLGPDGRVLKPDDFVPFSTGRRVCLGEQLARMEIFLFFSSLLHQFTIRKPDHSPPISHRGVLGATLNTEPFQACVIARQN